MLSVTTSHSHQKWPVYKAYYTLQPTHICQQHLRPKRVPIVPLCNYLSLIIRALWLIKAQQSLVEQWPDRQAVMLLLYRNHNNYLALSLSLSLPFSLSHTRSWAVQLFHALFKDCSTAFCAKSFFVCKWKAKCCQGICAGQEIATMQQGLVRTENNWPVRGEGREGGRGSRITHQFTRCARYLMIFHSIPIGNRMMVSHLPECSSGVATASVLHCAILLLIYM